MLTYPTTGFGVQPGRPDYNIMDHLHRNEQGCVRRKELARAAEASVPLRLNRFQPLPNGRGSECVFSCRDGD